VRGVLVCVGLLSAAFGSLPEARAVAGESVFLVVNERSWSSLSIANHTFAWATFCQQRLLFELGRRQRRIDSNVPQKLLAGVRRIAAADCRPHRLRRLLG
jgi:hypothetical protein